MLGLHGRPGLHGQRATRQEFASFLKFTVVRNPWARIYSWYQNVMRDPWFGVPPCDFGTFLNKHADNWALRPQTHWIKDFDGSLPLERIVRFENLADDMAGVLADLGFRDRTLPHLLKVDSGCGFRAAYNDQLAELVAERYRDEIKLFGYKF
jgi:hypothetical protein